MNNETATTKWNDFIPELYFDLIARVIPGGMLIAIYFLPHDFNEFTSFTTGVVYLFFSYFIGYVADVFGRLTIIKIFVALFENKEKNNGKPNSNSKDKSDRNDQGFFCDMLKIKYERNRKILEDISELGIDQQSVVKKLLAESSLLRVSAVLCLPCIFFLPCIFVISYDSVIYSRITIFFFSILLLAFHISSQELASERAESLLKNHKDS
jgi:hypothetical protein